MRADLYTELFGMVAALDDRDSGGTVGGITPVDREPVRFRGEAALAFIASAAADVRYREGQAEISSALFSLLGPIGSMPFVYSETVAKATRENETALRDFLDLLNHRSSSLMYRAWRKSRMFLEHQPGAHPDRQQKISAMLQGFAGITDLPERIAWLDFDRQPLLSCIDVFSRRVRNANGLRQLLNRQFRMQFEVDEFVGNWEPLPEEAMSSFSSSGNPPRLGYNTIVGSRTWQVQSTFRVIISHPTPEQYRELRPSSESLRRMQLMMRLYCTPELAFRIQIIVSGDTVEPGTLGGAEGQGAMLGWNTVIGKPDKDRDYVFNICRDYNESRMSP